MPNENWNEITGTNGKTPTAKGQTSGKVIHGRRGHMNVAGNVENTKNLPK
jgi:UDP-N-acetylmuramoylalanine-D-glutamate ligase